MTTIEPPQFAEKSVVIREATQPFYIEGYHRPDYRDPDDSVYDAITDIFSNGRTARLYRQLVRDQKIAAEGEGFSGFPGEKYPGLFAFYAVPLPGHTPEEMRTAIHKELDRLKTEDVSDEELARFKTRARADLLRGLADNDGLAHQLAEYQTRFGDWRELFRELDRINAVSKADIRRVANKVFVESNRTSARIEYVAPRSPLRLREARSERAHESNTTWNPFRNRCRPPSPSLPTFALSQARAPAAAKPAATATASPAQPWKKIPIPPLHAFKPQQPQRIELANGLVIFLQEDHELPFISGSILIRGGSRDEPADKIGLVSMYGQTWRTSGTAATDGDKLDDQLNAKAASLETSGGSANTSAMVQPQG